MAFPPAAIRIEREVGTGDAAIDRIVAHMSRLARRDAGTQQITTLARTLRGTDEFDTIRRIFFFIADLFRYKPDPAGYEYVVAPVHSLLLREGDCDCMTTALAALLMAAGFEVAFVVIAWDKKRCTSFGCPFTHVYLLVHTKTYGWIPLDPVMQRDGLGREKAPIIRRKRYVVKLVTLEDNLNNSTPNNSKRGTCRKRKVPVRLNIVNNIIAGNGNGNSQVRNNSPDAYSTNDQRHNGYYADNSERTENRADNRTNNRTERRTENRTDYRPASRDYPDRRPQERPPRPEQPSPLPQPPAERPPEGQQPAERPVQAPPPPQEAPQPEQHKEALPIYRRPRREFM